MRCFVTVGTTQFDELVRSVLSDSSCSALKKLGITEVVIQNGRGAYMPLNSAGRNGDPFECHGLKVTMFDYKDSLYSDMAQAELIIGHAGAGTSLEALRLSKPFIAVVNTDLMDDHQRELAYKLSSLGCIVATTPERLAETLDSFSPSCLKPYVAPDMKSLASAIDSLFDFN